MAETNYKAAPVGTDGFELENIPVKVHVTAPGTLPEGYVFEAEVGAFDNKKTISVEVPPGGVIDGQVFLVSLPPDFGDGEPQMNVPTGRWKDGIFDCWSQGLCHPHLWCAACFTQVAMAQVMQRLRLNWTGNVDVDAATKITYKVVLTLVLSYMVFSLALEVAVAGQAPSYINAIKTVGGILFFIWTTYALYKTRQIVRAKYSIEEEKCKGCEDLCCSLFCSCCAVAQIARHTGEYETNKATFCTETGLLPTAPVIV